MARRRSSKYSLFFLGYQVNTATLFALLNQGERISYFLWMPQLHFATPIVLFLQIDCFVNEGASDAPYWGWKTERTDQRSQTLQIRLSRSIYRAPFRMKSLSFLSLKMATALLGHIAICTLLRASILIFSDAPRRDLTQRKPGFSNARYVEYQTHTS